MDLTHHNVWQCGDHRTKRDAAQQIPLPADAEEYDTAVPQGWLDAAAEHLAEITGVDLSDAYTRLFGIVWLYRAGDAFGEPWPVTPSAIEALSRLATSAIYQAGRPCGDER